MTVLQERIKQRRPTPRTPVRNKNFSVAVHSAFHAAWVARAAEEGMTLTAWMEKHLRAAVRR